MCYRTRLLDGNHPRWHAASPRKSRAPWGSAPLPGQSLVILDPELMLVIDVIPCEDGHAQERSLSDAILASVRPRDLWIADRNFCTTQLLYGDHKPPSILHYSASIPGICTGSSSASGETRLKRGSRPARSSSKRSRRPTMREEVLFLRRVTVVLDEPTRDGETEIHVSSPPSREDASAPVIAELCRKRWTIETAFQELEETLQSEINTLGDPKAAPFVFCVALVAYNIMSTVKAALRCRPRRGRGRDTEFSTYDLAEEVAATHRGMMIAILRRTSGWSPSTDVPPRVEPGTGSSSPLLSLLSEYRKTASVVPKKPRPKRTSGAKAKTCVDGQATHEGERPN